MVNMNLKRILIIISIIFVTIISLLFIAVIISGDFSVFRPIDYDKLDKIGFFIFNLFTPLLTAASVLGVAYQYFNSRDKDRQIYYEDMLKRKVNILVDFMNTDYYKDDILGDCKKDLITVLSENIDFLDLEEKSKDIDFYTIYPDSKYIEKEVLLALCTVLIRKLISITDFIEKYNIIEYDTFLLEGFKFNFIHSLQKILFKEYKLFCKEIVNETIDKHSIDICSFYLDELVASR